MNVKAPFDVAAGASYSSPSIFGCPNIQGTTSFSFDRCGNSSGALQFAQHSCYLNAIGGGCNWGDVTLYFDASNYNATYTNDGKLLPKSATVFTMIAV